jgi:hypothetical protein
MKKKMIREKLKELVQQARLSLLNDTFELFNENEEQEEYPATLITNDKYGFHLEAYAKEVSGLTSEVLFISSEGMKFTKKIEDLSDSVVLDIAIFKEENIK